LVVWDSERGRTSFTLLQRRLSAGRRVLQLTIEHPAHLVFSVKCCVLPAGARTGQGDACGLD
jgi:hypothetical protein